MWEGSAGVVYAELGRYTNKTLQELETIIFGTLVRKQKEKGREREKEKKRRLAFLTRLRHN